MPMIRIVLFSYKSKRLQEIIDNIYATSELNSFDIKVFDQSNIKKYYSFKDYSNMDYQHINWDAMESPCKRKNQELQTCPHDFIMIMSDDVWLEKGWDSKLIDFAMKNDAIVSGRGTARVSYKDRYTIQNNPVHSEDFSLSQYIDRNLIFAKTDILKNIVYPPKLKYYGEEEMLSINILSSGIDIYNAPSNLYTDLAVRSIENLYTTFSKYHNFNNVHKALNSERAEAFLKYHNLDKDLYLPTPDLVNDVEYNAHDDGFFTHNAIKFINPANTLTPGEGVVK